MSALKKFDQTNEANGASGLAQVTPAMIKAGLDRLEELSGEEDRSYVVEAIYLAMEYERLDSIEQSPGFFDHRSKVIKG